MSNDGIRADCTTRPLICKLNKMLVKLQDIEPIITIPFILWYISTFFVRLLVRRRQGDEVICTNAHTS